MTICDTDNGLECSHKRTKIQIKDTVTNKLILQAMLLQVNLTRYVPRVYRARILAGAGHFCLRFSSAFISYA